jgi:hypothetical protein
MNILLTKIEQKFIKGFDEKFAKIEEMIIDKILMKFLSSKWMENFEKI